MGVMTFADRVVEVIADALLSADEDQETVVTECPGCREILTVYVFDKKTDHLPPLCPQWSEFCENWHPPKARLDD